MPVHRQAYRLSAAVLCAAAFVTALAVSDAARAAKGDIWTLERIVVTNHLTNTHAVPQNVRYDASGGSVTFNLGGAILNSCAPGNETVRFTWNFPADIVQIGEGRTVDVGLHGEFIGKQPPCTGHFAERSGVTASGSSGVTSALSDSEMRHVEIDRFATIITSLETVYASAAGKRTNTTMRVLLAERDFNPDRPFGYFMIKAVIFGSGEFKIVYIYRKGNLPSPFTKKAPPTGRDICGFAVGEGILNRWIEAGGQQGRLGCAVRNEEEAGRSPTGTTGRYVLFRGGVIVWHRDGARAGRAHQVYGCIGVAYQRMGGTNSWLGFPVSDEYDAPGGRRQDFEGGYMLFDASNGKCGAYRAGGTVLTLEPNMNRPGGDRLNFELQENRPELCRDSCASDPGCKAFTYVRPGVQGPKARCWLKSTVPQAVQDGCCVSGVRR